MGAYEDILKWFIGSEAEKDFFNYLGKNGGRIALNLTSSEVNYKSRIKESPYIIDSEVIGTPVHGSGRIWRMNFAVENRRGLRRELDCRISLPLEVESEKQGIDGLMHIASELVEKYYLDYMPRLYREGRVLHWWDRLISF